MTEQTWKPDRAEAQFLGELLNIDAGLSKIGRDMLAKGYSLSYVVDTFKSVMKVVSLVRGEHSK